MKTDTDIYEQMQKKEYKKNVKSKEKKHDIAMLKEMRRQKGELQRRYRAKQKTITNKQTSLLSHDVFG